MLVKPDPLAARGYHTLELSRVLKEGINSYAELKLISLQLLGKKYLDSILQRDEDPDNSLPSFFGAMPNPAKRCVCVSQKLSI